MKRKRVDIQWLVLALAGSALINLVMLPMFATADPLPPRGTPTPPAAPAPTLTPEPTAEVESKASSPVDGARLQLHVRYGESWDWDSMVWQDLWTEVEWTDGENWFPVGGWRGNLESIEQMEPGDWVSLREWWVRNKDLDTGPFRWVVYQGEGGEKLATSDPFRLSAQSGETMVINLTVK